MKRIRLTENNLRNMIREAVAGYLNEYYNSDTGKENRLRNIVRSAVNEALMNEQQIGGSGPQSQKWNYNTGKPYAELTGAQGGQYNYPNALDRLDADERAYKNYQAQQRQNSMSKYRDWCYANYDYVMSVCPGYMGSGEYKKAYDACN